MGFPGRSAGKESACNAGDPSSITGSGRFPGEGMGYPIQYSWVFLIAQMVKNLPAMQETWVQSLGWEDPLEEGMATHSSILDWRIPWTEEPGGLLSMRSQIWTSLSDQAQHNKCLAAWRISAAFIRGKRPVIPSVWPSAWLSYGQWSHWLTTSSSEWVWSPIFQMLFCELEG